MTCKAILEDLNQFDIDSLLEYIEHPMKTPLGREFDIDSLLESIEHLQNDSLSRRWHSFWLLLKASPHKLRFRDVFHSWPCTYEQRFLDLLQGPFYPTDLEPRLFTLTLYSTKKDLKQ